MILPSYDGYWFTGRLIRLLAGGVFTKFLLCECTSPNSSDMLNIFLIRPKNLARPRVCSLRTTKSDRLLDSQQYPILGTIQR